jgi:hypothetical protein
VAIYYNEYTVANLLYTSLLFTESKLMARLILPGIPDVKSDVKNNLPLADFKGLNNRDILKKRSKLYIHFFSKLDTKTLTNTEGWQEVMDSVQEEFGTADVAILPLGIVSKCFLGHPYEVHTIDLSGNRIVKHYTTSESMPDLFERARSLAKHHAYALIEVYNDKLVLIREDGSASKL